MNLPIERFNEVVEQATAGVLAEREHDEQCPCPDCRGPYYAAYQTVCKGTCETYQRWARA